MTQRLLLLAAADPTGDPVLLARAAGRLGICDAAAPAEAAGLVTVGAHVSFRHPLVRSPVYRAAPADERRAAHRALAEATDPDRRAWHRAQATPGPDDGVAGELERSADSARARGGLAAAAFLERSVTLTLDPARRADRALAAAQANYQAGAFDAGLALVTIAEEEPLDEFQQGRACLLRGEIALASRHGSDAPPLLLSAARTLDPLNVRLARGAYLEPLSAALMAGRLAGGGGWREVAEAARAARPSPRPARPADLLLDGLALVITEGYPAGAPLLQRAVRAVCRGGKSPRMRSYARYGRPTMRPGCCGTTGAGTCCLPTRSGSLVRPARSLLSPQPSTHARGCTCSPASSPRSPRSPGRCSRSPR